MDQGLHRHPARRARGGDRRGAQARDQGDGPSLLGDLPGGGGARHRQPRARPAHRHGLRRARRSRTIARATAWCARRSPSRPPRTCEGDDQEDDRQEGRDDVDARRVRAVLPEASGVRRAHAGGDDAGSCETRTCSTAPASTAARTIRSRREMLRNAMAFEKEFVAAGGLLAAGVDPDRRRRRAARLRRPAQLRAADRGGVHARADGPDHGAQRRAASSASTTGSAPSSRARSPTSSCSRAIWPPIRRSIRRVTTVFKDGVGYDSPRLMAAVKGRVGID